MKRYWSPLSFIFLFVFLFLVSCGNDTFNLSDVVDHVQLEIVERKEDHRGITYTLILKNNSDQIIKQNNVFLSYPIKTSTGTRSNEFKIEAENNKLNIKPKEEVLLSVFAPREMYESNIHIDINEPNIKIEGFINEVNQENEFFKGGGFKAMENF
ncbi:hypothetical protein [Paenibacillus senegalimassiliensis]|uniref:hypothetical protein n=1 Tax=Paenibacillus senegalimassiliensis TaxID=1737426 RepID=UPI00073E60FF|nr:hypothetical protein [Paenibacillus senegalimassiliensis]